jgi:hypothetical protein
MKAVIILLFLLPVVASAQWKSYRLINNGRDTVNCVDKSDVRQGRWIIKNEGLRGEPGYDEEGVYKDGKKEGPWRVYTSMGDLLAVERYRWGNKDGKSQYYDITGLVREESWKAVNPLNPYDTIDVYDPLDQNKVYRQVIKIEGTTVKHGPWNYYTNGLIVKSENYFLDKPQDIFKNAVSANGAAADSTGTKTAKAPAKVKPREVMEFEKKIGKKKVKVLDAHTY